MFELSGAKANRPERPRKQSFRYHPNDEQMLVETLKIRLENVQTPQELIDQTQLACEDALSDKIVGGRQPIHWWTPEVQELHREGTAARRLVLRERRRHGRVPPEHAEHYRQSRAALRQEIRQTKRRQWESLRLELNKNPWGTAYRVVCKKFAHRPRDSAWRKQNLWWTTSSRTPSGNDTKRQHPDTLSPSP